MFCPNCGTPVNENQSNCTSCGASLNAQSVGAGGQVPNPPYAPQTIPVTNTKTPGLGLAITSMVLGIVSLVLFCAVWLAIICAIVGVTLGGIALWKAKQVNAKSGMAVAGIACSCVSLGILIIYAILVATVFAEGAAILGGLFA